MATNSNSASTCFRIAILLVQGAIGAFASELDLEVMSFNIQQPFGTAWEQRRDIAAALLAREQPDIVGTQEAVADQRNYLIGKLPGYAWYGLGRDGGDNGEGCWIFYVKERFSLDSARSGNFWLSDTPKSPSRFGGAYNRICTYVRLIEKATGRGFYIFNAHLYTQDLAAYRMQSARMIAGAMALRTLSQDPVLATGDFNSPEEDAVTKWLKDGSDNPIPLRDSYRDFDPTGKVTTGFGTKFDYIYVEDKPGYQTLGAWVTTDPAGASDHMPISGSIRLTYPPPSSTLRPVPGRSCGFFGAKSRSHYSGRIDGRAGSLPFRKNPGS